MHFYSIKKRSSLLFSRKIEELLQHGSDAEGELQQGVERRIGGGRPVVDVRHRHGHGHRTRQGVADETLGRQVAEESLHPEAGHEPGDVKISYAVLIKKLFALVFDPGYPRLEELLSSLLLGGARWSYIKDNSNLSEPNIFPINTSQTAHLANCETSKATKC